MEPLSRRTVLAGLGALATVPLIGTGTATAAPESVIWDGDPARGTAVFDGLEKAPGSITVVNDATYGKCFRYETWDNPDGTKERCESRGLRLPDGSVYRPGAGTLGQVQYLGWRASWNVNPKAGKWIAVYQFHISGESSSQAQSGPFVLRTLGDGKLYFQLTGPSGASKHIWSTDFPVNTWSTFAIGYQMSRGNDGWCEFYYNGKQQTFSNGQTRYPGPTLWGDHVNHKWGVYRSGGNSGHATALLNHARLGSTYADVAA
ncbi:heparin lyase I family protein [Amycolatopsis sp. cmx-4-68]|uniref:heparin lyase I family protein n=1 Tax=Amycolatopsis sp. cmx-4-68 TaxID=2790938 RepID=UPI00397A939B